MCQYEDWVRRFHRVTICFVISALLAGCAGSLSHQKPSRTVKPESGKKDASYYYLLSEAETRRNDAPKALEYLNEAIKKDDHQARFWYKRAFLHAAMGDLKASEEDIHRALGLDPEDDEALVLLGKIHQSQDRRPQAIEAYQRALRVNPASEDANVLLIEALVAQKDYASALRSIAAWQRADPENVAPFFYEAWIYQNFLKDPARAITAYQKVLNVDPDNLKALSALSELHVARRDEKKVIEVFSRMEAISPNDVSLKLKLALVYYDLKQYDQAVKKFDELLQSHPNEDRIIYYLGVVYENLKRDAEAEEQFLKIKTDSTFFKDARLHMAFLKVRAGKKGEGIALLKDAINRRPGIGPFYEYLAQIYRDDRNYPAAIDVLKRGIQRSPEKELLYYTLGLVYDRAGRFEECIHAMREALKINPQNPNAMNYIGYSYADRGLKLDEALDLLQNAVALKPDDGYITDSLGWVYFQRGELDEAFKYIQKAYGMVPGEPTIAEHLGDIYAKKNDKARALRYYRESASNLEKKKDEGENAEDLERVKKKIKEIQK